MYTNENIIHKILQNIDIVTQNSSTKITEKELQENFYNICSILFGIVLNFIIKQLLKVLFLQLVKINFFTSLVTLINTA
jgi:hypothetical protein